MRRGALAILGGSWHDFVGFESWLSSNEYTSALDFEVSADLSRLSHLQPCDPSLLLLFNCIDDHCECAYTESQIDALVDWVEQGGRLLALHAATVAAQRNAKLRRLLGGAFVDHPPQCELLISPIGPPHPITSGIEPFRVVDELYRHQLEPDLSVHLVAADENGWQPIGWTAHRGGGKVAYLGLGHDAEVWRHPKFGILIRQALSWLQGTVPSTLLVR